MLLVCPECQATNRVPEDRLQDDPNCGRCHAALQPGRPVTLDDRRFVATIAQDVMPVLVDYWADWCGPCKMMAPQFERAAARLPRVRFAKLDTDANPRTSSSQQIRSIPTLALYHRGRELGRLTGAMRATDLVNWVQEQLDRAGLAATV